MNSTPAHHARAYVAIGLRTLVLGTAAAILAGCYTASEALLDSIPEDYRQRHPIVLKEAPRTVELFIGNRRGTLTATQRADVLAFAQTWRNEGTGGLIIDVPAGTPNERSAAAALQEVRSILAAAGVPPDAVATRPNTAGGDPRKLATMRLHYPRVTADAGPCGLWPYDLGPTYHREHYENRQFYNLGCSTQRNMAAMVENPSDLVQPRSEIPTYTARRTVVLDKYRKGESTATVYPDAAKGKISDVGN
ncbi:MAG: CpaD family pilus assembly protein [Xanthobacteraceae bacterium]|nr:CpaD family pilus assembly protein [Xanthobacteraceae bacterium]MBX9829840.1 CpaD family pilus assembly protein [Xanthobacteraceae bacterium]